MKAGKTTLALLSIAASAGACALVLEIALRFAPVNSGTRAVAVNAAQPVFRFTPDRELTYSARWNFENANRVRVNNAGFVNAEDYRADDPRPLLAVIGDSYIEGLVVPQRDTLHARLAGAAAPGARVYSFAASGAPLSQYLAWAELADEHYGARGAVILVVGNDFDESLAAYKRGPGFHHYVERDGELRLELVPYRPNPLRAVVYHSALASYLVFNLKALDVVALTRARLRSLTAEPAATATPTFVGNTAATAGDARLVRSKRAVDAFLRDLTARTRWRAEDVVLVLDGIRAYEAGRLVPHPDTYFARMRRYLAERATARGHEVIDMHPILDTHYAEHGRRFEFENDSHWNALAHGLAAEAVLGSRTYRRFSGATGGD